MALDTPYGVWLDADDQLLPGRLDGMIEALEYSPADIVSDGAELFDGPTGEYRQPLPIPNFLLNRNPVARLFERNYLPAPGAIGFRTDFAKRIGYDPELNGAEDYDFLLRAIGANARVCFLESSGYRLYAYPQSLSRKIENQWQMTGIALSKHSYQDVRNLYNQAGYDDRIASWGLVSMAMYRSDYRAALEFIAQAEQIIVDPSAVLEPDGPMPYPEGWRAAFFKATALLLLNRPKEAHPIFEFLMDGPPSAVVCNNFGVTKWKTGDQDGAERLFEQSIQLFPGYFDAQINLESATPNRITTHPLRTGPARMDYSSASKRISRSRPC
jgi:tetratricopeptide (TPR) repeat protein